MKFYIGVRSKWTGTEIRLGMSYPSYKDAEKAAEKEVCLRCNRYSIHSCPDDWEWQNKELGFRPVEERRIYERKHTRENKREENIKYKKNLAKDC